MPLDTKPNLTNRKFEQLNAETLNLSGITSIYGCLSIKPLGIIDSCNNYMMSGVTMFATPRNTLSSIYIGQNSGNGNNGNGIIAIGSSVLDVNLGNCNIGIGNCALNKNLGGSNNIGIGDGSLSGNTTGSGNIGLGLKSSFCNTIGCDNIAIGINSLLCNSSGDLNVAIGCNSLCKNSTGIHNIGIGGDALRANNSSKNISIGYSSLKTGTLSCDSIAIGECSMNIVNACNSIAIGSLSASQIGTSNQNISIGSQSLYGVSNSTSACNIAIGGCSMYCNNSGNNNIAMGMLSLRSNNNGNNNIALGCASLYSNTNGCNNLAFGLCSNYSNITGNGNLSMGVSSLLSNTIGNNNIALGELSLRSNTVGCDNVGLGLCSLYSNVSGNSNIAIGNLSLRSNVGGCDNIGFGSYTLYANTIGCNNIAMGFCSLCCNVNGNNNFAAGYAALRYNCCGDNNIALGFQTLHNNCKGCENIAIGGTSLKSNIVGDRNIAIGYGTLSGNTSSDNNIGIGWSVLIANNSIENIGIGGSSLKYNTTGCRNLAIGRNSLYGLTTGSNNIALGYYAGSIIGTGATSNQFSSNSIFIGCCTRAGHTSGCNEIVIGVGALGCGTNSVVLGNDNIVCTNLKGNIKLPTTPSAGSTTDEILVWNSTDKTIKKVSSSSTITGLTSTYLKLDQSVSQTIVNGQPIFNTLTPSELVATDANKKLQSLSVGTYPSLAELAYVKGTTSSIQTQINSKKPYHGVESYTTPTFDDASHVVTIPAITYWYKGTKVVKSTPTTCDIDTYQTLTANRLYYIAFDDASGTLKAFTSMNLRELVPTCMIYWNGSSGALTIEMHNHTRDIDWHISSHLTIGTRYYNGLGLTAPTTALDDDLTVATGIIYDEDIRITIPSISNSARLWYQVSDGVYTWTDITRPYSGALNTPTYLDTNTYTLTVVPSNRFTNYWVYATNDINKPIYIIPTQASTNYNTINDARLETPPVLRGLTQELAPEWKLIYRFIYKGDGEFQEFSDYRTVSSLPGGGIAPSQAASAISYVPGGNISATNVQTAIEELDNEKLNINQTTPQTLIGSPIFSGLTATVVPYIDANRQLKDTVVKYDPVKEQLQIGNVASYNNTYGLTIEKGIITNSFISVGGGTASLRYNEFRTNQPIYYIKNIGTDETSSFEIYTKNLKTATFTPNQGLDVVGKICSDSLNVANGINITGVTKLYTTPATGVGTDSVLVWNSVDKTVKQINPSGITSGLVTGATGSTDNAIARFDGTTGKIIQNSNIIAGDSGTVFGTTEIGNNVIINSTIGSELAPPLEAANWTFTSGSGSVSGGVAILTPVALSYARLRTANIGIVSGEIYKITFTSTQNGGSVFLGDAYILNKTTPNTYTTYAVAGTGGYIELMSYNVQATITSISIKKLESNSGDLTTFGKLNTIGLFNLGGVQFLDVNDTGSVGIKTTASQSGYGLRVGGNLGLVNGSFYGAGFTTDAATQLYGADGGNLMGIRRGTTPTGINLYNTYTNTSNYERLQLTGVAGSDFKIEAQTLGTGADNLNIRLIPAGDGVIKTYGGLEISGNTKLMNTPSSGSSTDGILVWNSTDKCIKQVTSVNCATNATNATNAGSATNANNSTCLNGQLSSYYAVGTHFHGNITNGGCIGVTSGCVLVTTTGGLITIASSVNCATNATTATNSTCLNGQLASYYAIASDTITTANNGLNKIGQNVRLGGVLTGNTSITGAYTLGLNNTILNLTGSTAVNISGPTKLLSTPATGGGTDGILVWNSTDKCVKQVTSNSITSGLTNTYLKLDQSTPQTIVGTLQQKSEAQHEVTTFTIKPALETVYYSNNCIANEVRFGTITSANMFYGVGSGRFVTSGFNNTGVGYCTLVSNTSGNHNSSLGTYSLASNVGGCFLVGIGLNAGRYLADGSSSNTGSCNSIYLGASTKAFADSGINEIVIGYNTIGGGSNTVVLGNDNITTSIFKGNIKLPTTPATGVGTDGILVWNSTDKCVKQVTSVNCATNATNATNAGSATNANNSTCLNGQTAGFYAVAAHGHGSINTGGCIGSASGCVLVTTTGGMITVASSVGCATNATNATNSTCLNGQLASYYAVASNVICTANNGLTKSGQNVRLGGVLTGNTSITGAFTLGFNNSILNLTGSTSVNISGPTKLLSTPATGVGTDGILVWNSTDKCVKTITCACIIGGAITTANNGLNKVGQNVRLGGALTGNTSITGNYTLNFCSNAKINSSLGYQIGGNTILKRTPITSDSIFLGISSGNVNTGWYNVGVGRNTLLCNTFGDNNTAIGSDALYFNVSGYCNTSVGNSNLLNNISGSLNVSIGNNAGSSNTSGSNNVFIGSNSGSGFNVNSSNKLYIANCGTCNLIYGDFTGNTVTLPKLCLCETPSSGCLNNSVLLWDTTDKCVKSIPISSITSGSTGGGISTANNGLNVVGNNVRLGGVLTGDTVISNCSILFNNTTLNTNRPYQMYGIDLIRFESFGGGYYVGDIGFKGKSSIGIGDDVFNKICDIGKYNIGIGRNVLPNSCTTESNIGIGDMLLMGGTDVSVCLNISMGYNILNQTNDAINNIGIGTHILNGLTAGNNNIAIGYNVLENSNDGNYSNNIAIGNNIGNDISGDNSIYIGNGAGQSNQCSNQLFIANDSTYNLIHGDFSTHIVTLPFLKLCETPSNGNTSADKILVWNSADKCVKALTSSFCTKQDKNLVFTNLSGLSWYADTTYAGYGYAANITTNGVTSSDIATVIFGHTEAISGNYSPVSITSADRVTIFAKVNTAITIPTIIITKV